MPLTPSTAQICAQWRDLVELQGLWRRAPNQAGIAPGEAGGYFVELDNWAGRRAYLKPTKKHQWKRAAREKIAADLAFDLGVSAPPVLLAVNERNPEHERFACVSLVLFEHQFSWGQLRDRIDDAEIAEFEPLRSRLPSDAARALALDAWLDQTDHKDAPAMQGAAASNIVYGYPTQAYDSGQFIFLDYAFSMGVGGRWDGSASERTQEPEFPQRMLTAVDRATLEAMVQTIETYEDERIEGVVSRIGWQWLPDEEGTKISTGLKTRRRLVRSILKRYLVT